jgi:glycosyltransferase involved in cell wall biosynthesis
MKKIIHIITGLNVGGAEMSLYKFTRSDDDTKQLVISLSGGNTLLPKFQNKQIEVHVFNFKSPIKSFIALYLFIKKQNPDIIQGWMYHGNVVAYLVSKASKKNIVIWNIRHSLYSISHEKFVTRQVIKIGKFISNKIDFIVYNSAVSKALHEGYGFSNKKSCVIYNGFAMQNTLYKNRCRKKSREIFGIDDDLIIIGHIGRFHAMKDHELFIKMSLKLLEKSSNIGFMMVGANINYQNPTLRELIPEKYYKNFWLIGESSNISSVMCVFDIFCQSSWSEAFPNVVGEAMAMEIPCIATDVGDTKLLIGDERYIVPKRNLDELYDAMYSMVFKKKIIRDEIGKNLKMRIEKNFPEDAVKKNYMLLYQQLLNDE